MLLLGTGNYKRRRVPRDLLMACQFVRETDLETCVGCEACVDACPIDAVEMKSGRPAVDPDWCIGCGVCTRNCPTESIKMVRRHDIEEPLPSMKSSSMDRMNQKTERSQQLDLSARDDGFRAPGKVDRSVVWSGR